MYIILQTIWCINNLAGKFAFWVVQWANMEDEYNVQNMASMPFFINTEIRELTQSSYGQGVVLEKLIILISYLN